MRTMQGKFRAAMLMGAAASVMVFAVGAKAQKDNPWPYDNPPRVDIPFPFINQSSPVLAVVGDIACQPGTEVTDESSGEVCTDSPGDTKGIEPLWQSQEATANEIETIKPDAVALLGDLQYQTGRYSDYEQSFDLTYGAFKFLHRPAPGNHEFYNEHSETGVAGYGYFSYYNGFQLGPTGTIPTITIANPCPVVLAVNPSCKAGKTPTADLSPQPIPRANGQAGPFEEAGGVEPSVPAGSTVGVGDGWYSYNLGSWHLISLNIECYTQPDTYGADGCSSGNNSWFNRELAWLKQDLEANHSPCTLAYWHQPTFSATNGITEEGETAVAFWKLLYEHGADLVLNGHDHLYARYKPLAPYYDKTTGLWTGKEDQRRGIREFIVGTGGETLDPVFTTTVTAAQATANPALTETNMEDPSGNVNFNAENLETSTEGGEFWGVMALTLDPYGYKWDFESALPDLQQTTANASFSDKGVGACHGPVNW